ncbi:MAG: ATP adenylyltransferase, partial [Aphanocapsa feldmannii 277cI]
VPLALAPEVDCRRLLDATPKHLLERGPKPNPFAPWDSCLAVAAAGADHMVILNKFPVQLGHLLLITRTYANQSAPLEPQDCVQALNLLRDCPGLLFFNSGPAAGASQPHRHLQLLPLASRPYCCPWSGRFLEAAHSGRTMAGWDWPHVILPLPPDRNGADLLLYRCYQEGLEILGLRPSPQGLLPPHNLMAGDGWFLMVPRRQEVHQGISINALGFCGLFLLTERGNRAWLERRGVLPLLGAVAC